MVITITEVITTSNASSIYSFITVSFGLIQPLPVTLNMERIVRLFYDSFKTNSQDTF